MYYHHWFISRFEKNCIGNLVNSPTRRVGESFFDHEYLREFGAKIGTARNVVWTHEEPIYTKTPQKIRLIAMSL